MNDWRVLPEVLLPTSGSPFSVPLRKRGVTTLRDSARYLQQLPYGRTSDRSDPGLVLEEKRGTCSTKHALLYLLAQECDVAVKLVLGIYEMCEANTPGVGAVLQAHGLSSIPEAHVYLRYDGQRVDITRDATEPAEEIHRFLVERVIYPEDIGKRKVTLHRRFIRRWLAERSGSANLTPERIWTIREECIHALNETA